MPYAHIRKTRTDIYVTALDAEVTFYQTLGFSISYQVNDLAEAVKICRQHGYQHTMPTKYWEQGDGWEMQIWSPNGYKINLEGHTPGPLD